MCLPLSYLYTRTAMTLVMSRRPLSFGVFRSLMLLQMLGPNAIILSLALNQFVDINVAHKVFSIESKHENLLCGILLLHIASILCFNWL